MMDFQKLFWLMSLKSPDDLKFYESWDDDWDWLYSYGFIVLDDDEKPFLTEKGDQAVAFAVKKAGEV